MPSCLIFFYGFYHFDIAIMCLVALKNIQTDTHHWAQYDEYQEFYLFF